MLKKIFMALAVCSAPHIMAHEPAKQEVKSATAVEPTVEFKAGYFFFASSKMRDIYNTGGLDLQLCGSYPIWKWLQFYGSVEYLQRSGHSLAGKQSTSIWQLPVNLGVKPVVTICPEVKWYFAVGPRYFYLHQHNNSSYVPRNKAKSGLGMFVNTGFNFVLRKHLLIDIFGEYSYEKVNLHAREKNVYSRNMQVGGFTFGGGLGYVF